MRLTDKYKLIYMRGVLIMQQIILSMKERNVPEYIIQRKRRHKRHLVVLGIVLMILKAIRFITGIVGCAFLVGAAEEGDILVGVIAIGLISVAILSHQALYVLTMHAWDMGWMSADGVTQSIFYRD